MIDEISLTRDQSTNALINNDINGYKRAMLAKKKAQKEKQEIETMKQDISEIKSLLKQLLEEKNG